MNSWKSILQALVLAGMLVCPAVAGAAVTTTVAWDQYSGVPGASVDFYTFGGAAGSASLKTIDGYKSLGVEGGVTGEISIGQSITVTYAAPQIIDQISLVALFAKGGDGDLVCEQAQITARHGEGESVSYLLQAAKHVESAIWTGLGELSSPEPWPGKTGYGGVWTLRDPFGDLAVSALEFTALKNGGEKMDLGSTNSDYGINAVVSHATPIPGAAWLLGSGLVALLGLRRRLLA